MRKCFSNSTMWRSKKRHSLQPLTCIPRGPLQLRTSGVHFQALPGCVHCISRSLQLSFRLGVSTPTSPGSSLLLGWDHQFSRPHYSPVLSICPLHTNSGCGKERRILIGFHGDLPRQHTFGTTLKFTSPVPADSRQWTPSVRYCVTR